MKATHELNFWPSFIDLILMLLFAVLVVLIIYSSKVFISESVKQNQLKIKMAVKAAFPQAGTGEVEKKLWIDINNDGKPDLTIQDDLDRQIYRFSEWVLFDSGKAILKPKGKELLSTIGRIWKTNSERYDELKVDGHTDSVPIHTEEFKSNWHLGAERAVEVVYFLQNQAGLSPYKGLSANSYAEFRPAELSTQTISEETIEKYNSPEHRLLNRRIDIVLKVKRS